MGTLWQFDAGGGGSAVPYNIVKMADMRVWFFISMSVLVPMASADFLWTEANCPAAVGNVTDSICCGEAFCGSFLRESDCHSETDDAALYCVWKEGKCSAVTDRKSNVCCLGEGMSSCASILNGRCPESFQVKKECCRGAEFNKFAFLETANDDELVCCNAPCAAMEKANCPLTDQCAPSKKSWGLHHPLLAHGFHPRGYGGFDHKFGTILYGTGFGRDYPRRRRGYGHRHDPYETDYEKNHDHVGEITVDDLMLTLVDILEKQSDVKVYDADITSDPYLGKTKSGGLFVDHSFPDPEDIIDEIFGEPRFYDYGWPIFDHALPPYSIVHHNPYAWNDVRPYGDHGTYQPPHQSYVPEQQPSSYPAPTVSPPHYPSQATYPQSHGYEASSGPPSLNQYPSGQLPAVGLFSFHDNSYGHRDIPWL